uniref:alpha-amylase family glycosyl hydrolase n=1 Tax=Agathobacter sp. TaxID=2021311 RepID=UPI004057B975
MAWYDEAVFYHIYPLGLSGAPKHNAYEAPVHRLRDMKDWIGHVKEIGCNAIYIGPLFESVGHGYETTDYKKLDSRLGDNEDLKDFVATCHSQGIRVIFDGVFNHTGRDFFAFSDIRRNRENSPYKDWYCNVNFWGNTEYNDGFSYENWGGYNLLAKLNQHNPAVRDYICDVIRFWVSEFDVDGIRLDAADVMDFSYMQALRQVANEVKPDFWLMGEVIHGDYTKWANDNTLHAVTNYQLHKALYSGHNDHNYFEIAHTVKRLYEMGQGRLKLYNFTDNHDVERIYTKLNNKAHFAPVHILTYTLPGVPSVYYGSEFGIEGRKEQWSDDSLRPCLNLADFKDAKENNPCTKVISRLGKVRQRVKALSYGDYKELLLTNRQYAYSRNFEGSSIVVTVNNDDSDYVMTLPAGNAAEYIGALSGQRVSVVNGNIVVNVKANYGDIWVPYEEYMWACEEENKTNSAMEEDVNADAQSENTENAAAESSNEDLEVSSMAEVLDAEAFDEETGGNAQEAEMPSITEEQAADIDNLVEDESFFVDEDVLENEYNTEESDTDETSVTKEHEAKVKATEQEMQTVSQPKAETAEKENEPQISSPTAMELAKAAYEKAFEEGRIAGLQDAIIARMERNGYVTDQMRNDARNQTHIPSLINWIKSF